MVAELIGHRRALVKFRPRALLIETARELFLPILVVLVIKFQIKHPIGNVLDAFFQRRPRRLGSILEYSACPLVVHQVLCGSFGYGICIVQVPLRQQALGEEHLRDGSEVNFNGDNGVACALPSLLLRPALALIGYGVIF
jgi:hypothetical protein